MNVDSRNLIFDSLVFLILREEIEEFDRRIKLRIGRCRKIVSLSTSRCTLCVAFMLFFFLSRLINPREEWGDERGWHSAVGLQATQYS